MTWDLRDLCLIFAILTKYLEWDDFGCFAIEKVGASPRCCLKIAKT